MSIEEKVLKLTNSDRQRLNNRSSAIKYGNGEWSINELINIIIWIKYPDHTLDTIGCSISGKYVKIKTFSYTPDSLTLAHKNNFLELSYCEKGTLKKVVNRERLDFKEGEIAIINGENMHCEYMEESYDVYLFLDIDKDYFKEMPFFQFSNMQSEKFIKELILSDTQNYKTILFTPKSQKTKVQQLFERITDEIIRQEPGFSNMITGYVDRILNLLIFEYKISMTKRKQSEYNQKLFYDIDLYIRKNYSSVSEKQLSQVFYYSPEYINKIIKKHTKMSYSKYLRKVRLEKIMRDLQNTQKNIDEIARNAGYTNLSFFYKAFKEEYGVTPNEARYNRNF